MNNGNPASTQLNGILSIVDDAIICMDGQHKIILFNQGAERLFGWTAQEANELDLNMLLPQRHHATHRGHIAHFDRSGQRAQDG